ncbi:MAG TPA: helix-turn-helix domain-containing protein [Gemmataceae bacterium]
MTRRATPCRLYPNAAQEQTLAALLEAHRHLYNGWLDKCRLAHEAGHSSYSPKECVAWFRRACRRHPPWAQLEPHSVWATLRRASRVYRLFLQRCGAGRRSRYPSLESRLSFTRLEFNGQDGVRLAGRQLEIQGVGAVRVPLRRPVPGVLVALTLKREEDKWYAFFHRRCCRPAVSPWGL